jgi:transcription antitermination factor NusG
MVDRSAKQWHVLHVKRYKEKFVVQQLEALNGVEEIFFPTFRGVRAARSKPYFPGYLFLRLDFDLCHENSVLWLPGVKDLVRLGGEVVTIPGEYIDELKQHLSSDETGYPTPHLTKDSGAKTNNRPARPPFLATSDNDQDSEAFFMGLLKLNISSVDNKE